MLNSLKAWINVDADLLTFLSRNGAGDETFATANTIKVYPVSEITTVRNYKGTEVTSNTQLYVDGSVSVNEHDRIIFEGTERPIQAIRTFYRNGAPDIKVVYL